MFRVQPATAGRVPRFAGRSLVWSSVGAVRTLAPPFPRKRAKSPVRGGTAADPG